MIARATKFLIAYKFMNFCPCFSISKITLNFPKISHYKSFSSLRSDERVSEAASKNYNSTTGNSWNWVYMCAGDGSGYILEGDVKHGEVIKCY